MRLPDVAVPVATLLPWSLRTGLPGEQDEMADFVGSLVPLPRTAAEKQEWSDGRPSLDSLYADREEYLRKHAAAASELAGQGFLLEEDLPRIAAGATRLWDWVQAR